MGLELKTMPSGDRDGRGQRGWEQRCALRWQLGQSWLCHILCDAGTQLTLLEAMS